MKFLIMWLTGLGLYCLLTLPYILWMADKIDGADHNIGFKYPQWLLLVIALISGILGVIIAELAYKRPE